MTKINGKVQKVLLAFASLTFVSCGFFSKSSKSEISDGKVSFMLVDTSGNPLSGDGANKIIDTMKKWTGVDVEFQYVPTDQYNEKLSEVLAHPETAPMIMHINKMNQEVVSAANDGLFWDLNEFIWDKSKYPNLSQANKNVCKSLEVNGKLIGIYKARDIGRNGLSYRKDWAEKLGLGEPKNPEDVYKMLHAFTYGDPDGNGIDDTWGLAMCSYTGPFDIIQTWFGCGNAWAEENGKVLPVHQTAAYKDALDWMRVLYREGLIPSDWRDRETKTWQAQVTDGHAGVFIDVMDGGRRIWDKFVTEETPSVVDSSKIAEMSLTGSINNATLATSGYNGFIVITKTAAKEDVEKCLQYLDKMCDDQMIVLAAYGLEGSHYTIKDGNIVRAKDHKSSSSDYSALNQTQCFIPHVLNEAKPALVQNERKQKEIQVIKENQNHAVFNPAVSYLANSPTYAEVGGELDSIISEARTKYICGEINEAGLQDAFDKWNKSGGTAVLSEVNEQYRIEKEKQL